jgi:uncharacterized membrane protein YkoI
MSGSRYYRMGMRKLTKLRLPAMPLMLVLAMADPRTALAREHHNRDSDVARTALQHGEVLPIGRVLALATQYLPGDVVDVRLDPTRTGKLLYKIRVLTRSGHIQELVLDARSGMFIRIED